MSTGDFDPKAGGKGAKKPIEMGGSGIPTGKIRIKVNKAAAPLKKAIKRVDPKAAPQFTDEDVTSILEDSGLPPRPEKRQYDRKQTQEEVDYRRKQIHRLLLRGVPKKTITEYLNISMSSLYYDISAINSKMKEEMANLDYPLFVGQTLAFFDECRNIALRLATDTKEKSNLVKMRALDVSIKAEVEKHRYLELVGLYRAPSPIDVGDGTARVSDADEFMNLLEKAVTGAIPDTPDVYKQVGLLPPPSDISDADYVDPPDGEQYE